MLERFPDARINIDPKRHGRRAAGLILHCGVQDRVCVIVLAGGPSG